MTSEVIQKQRLLHENEIVQLLHNYKCYGVDQTRFEEAFKEFCQDPFIFTGHSICS